MAEPFSRRERTRERMLAGARALLERQGAGYVSLARVAAEAGVSRQSVYEHFGSRAGLLLALVDFVDESEGIGEHVRPVREAVDGVDALERFVAAVAAMTPRIHAVARAIHRERERDPAAAAAWDDRMRRRRADIRRIVERLREEGRLAPEWSVPSATDWIWAVTGVPAWEQLAIESGWSPRRYRTHVTAALRGALLTAPDDA